MLDCFNAKIKKSGATTYIINARLFEIYDVQHLLYFPGSLGRGDAQDVGQHAQLEANLCTEVAMVVLDVACLYTNNFKVR